MFTHKPTDVCERGADGMGVGGEAAYRTLTPFSMVPEAIQE